MRAAVGQIESTPNSAGSQLPDFGSPMGAEPPVPDFELLPRVVNPPGWVRKPKEAYWQERDLMCVKYIDDGLLIEKINLKEEPLLEENGVQFKDVNPPKSQIMFDHISKCATDRGMIVNKKKTGLMCTSAAVSFEPRAHLRDEDGSQISSQKSLKVLGFTFDSDASVKTQANAVKSKLRARTWTLEKLKKCGLSEKELVRVFSSSIRPVAEYVSPVLHPMLNDYQSQMIERQQNQALKFIFGPDISAAKMRKKAGIITLKERRESAAKKFAQKTMDSGLFPHWFEERRQPGYARRENTTYRKVVEKPA